MKRTAVGVLGLMLAAVSLPAHHSFSAEFDINQPITLQGVLTKMEWVNPHGWIYMDVNDPNGVVVNWAIETGSPTSLLRRGLRHTDFPPGLEIIVEGYRALDGTLTANGITVKFHDGRNFFAGPSGSGAPVPKP